MMLSGGGTRSSDYGGECEVWVLAGEGRQVLVEACFQRGQYQGTMKAATTRKISERGTPTRTKSM